MASSTHDRAALRTYCCGAATRAHTNPPLVGASNLHSIALAPLTEADLQNLREVGREVRAFETLAVEIMRTQATMAVMPPQDDPEALRGLRRTERRLLLEALSLGTEGLEEMRLAAALTRCVTDDGDNLIAMLAAALETDSMRMGLAPRRGREDGPDA